MKHQIMQPRVLRLLSGDAGYHIPCTRFGRQRLKHHKVISRNRAPIPGQNAFLYLLERVAKGIVDLYDFIIPEHQTIQVYKTESNAKSNSKKCEYNPHLRKLVETLAIT